MARRERPLDQRPAPSSDPYLVFCTIAVVVAMVGAFILLTDDGDVLGRALLLGGDAAAVTGFVVYVRRSG